MFYKFPKISHIDQVIPAVEHCPEFVVADRGEYTIINYNVEMADTFPPVIVDDRYDLVAAIRRECRGIIFCNKTGNIIRRPFHKFFNVNQREETQQHRISLAVDHILMDKLDGSMIAPFRTHSGKLIWGTKMAAPDFHNTVQSFVESRPEYTVMAVEAIRRGFTPIFEWCSRHNRIVVDYVEDQLVLTAVRHMITGEYLTRATLQELSDRYNIPIVQVFDSHEHISSLIDFTQNLQDVEGFVVCFDGHKIKIKCDWYVQIHKAKEKILFDRHIIEMILGNTIDDILPHLIEEDRSKLIEFQNTFLARLNDHATILSEKQIARNAAGIDRKTFALGEAKEIDGFSRAITFSIWENPSYDNAWNALIKMIENHLSTNTKWEEFRDVMFPGVVYND